MEVLENLPLLAEEVEWNREEGTSEEKPQEAIVNCTNAEHSLGSEGSPEDGSGKGSVDTRAGEMVLLTGHTNTGNLRHLVVEDSRANKTGNEGGDHLATESDPRRYVGVMGKLEVLGKAQGVRSGDISVGLEEVHAVGVTGEPETTEQLGNDVEGYLHVGDGLDDAARNTKDDGK